MRRWTIGLVGAIALALVVDVVTAQPPGEGGRGRGRRGPEAREPGERPGPPRGQDARGPGAGFRRPQMPLMTALDADRDGEISAKEIENAVEALKKLDKDGDGTLSREELRPEFPGPGGPGGFGMGGGPGGPGDFRRGGGPGGPGDFRRGPDPGDFVERLMSQDANGDGKVTKDELPEPMQRVIERGDANGDGAIDKEEAEKLAAQLGRGGAGPGGPGGADFVERFMRQDANGDGKVTKDELPEQMQRILERADANGDGAIDKEEAEKMAEQFQRRGGERRERPPRPQRPSDA